MKLRLFAPVALLVPAACATSTDGPSSAESQIHTAAGVCAPLDYHHTATPAQFYRQFDSDEAMADYLMKLIVQGQLAALSGPDATFREITHDERLTRIIGEVYAGFLKAFPHET